MDDIEALSAYSQCMSECPAFLELRIETKEPIEVGAFVGQFTALANQYERFVKLSDPNRSGSAEFFVAKIEEGSIIAQIVPDFLLQAGTLIPVAAANATEVASAVMVLEDFVKRWGGRLSKYFYAGGRDTDASKGDLKDFCNAVAAIARDPQASSTLSVAYFEDGQKKTKSCFQFNTSNARQAEKQIEEHKTDLDSISASDFERVIMSFVRSDLRNSVQGKRSGEYVCVEDISPKPLPLVYASELAELRIKAEIRDDSSVYKKGFVVDVNVATKNGKPIAYRITNLHQVIDLPDD